MFKRKGDTPTPVSLTGTAYGLTVTLQAPSREILRRMRPALPPGWSQDGSEPAATELRFALTTEDRAAYRITVNESPLTESALEDVLDVLPGMVRQYVAGTAPEVVFVHAGAVAYNGQGIVIPGSSFSGKSTLVTALVSAGADYYSDEYAVITPEGWLIPYAKDVSLRLTPGQTRQTDRSIADLGGTVGVTPVRIALLLLTEYRARASWDPQELSVAQGVVEMLGHAEPVQDRPAETVSSLRRALDGARVLKGRRGDAAQTAAAVIAELSN